MQQGQFKPGGVYSYTPKKWHAREGTAIATDDGYLRDTFWTSDRPKLTQSEADTAEHQFDMDEVRPARPRENLDVYAPGSVRAITSQHGRILQHFVVKGAHPSRGVILKAAMDRVASAARTLEVAREELEFARREVERLEEQFPVGVDQAIIDEYYGVTPEGE